MNVFKYLYTLNHKLRLNTRKNMQSVTNKIDFKISTTFKFQVFKFQNDTLGEIYKRTIQFQS
jgi:hypothetical protein